MSDSPNPGLAPPLPLVDDETRPYWEAGRNGRLSFAACNGCGALLHPPQPVCRYCRSQDIGRREVEAKGILVGFTVNHHLWDPRFPPPYILANVAVEADPRVRVLSRLVDTEADQLRVGMRVEARFEHVEDVWIPYFTPSGQPDDAQPDAGLPEDETPPDDHRRWVRPVRAGTRKFEDDVALTGIGMSAIGRRLMRDPLSLTVEAVEAAVADAGLGLEDIDGLSTYPGSAPIGGFSEGGITALEDALGIRPVWYNGGAETFGPAGSVIAAMLAVSAGLARHVLCFRTVWQSTFAARMRARAAGGSPYSMGSKESRIPGYSGPYGFGSAANNLALCASHHFAKYGTDRETLGWIALNQRANAALNPQAIYRDPLTMDDYMGARLITTPFGLYDCDVPADASIAVIVSHVDAAKDLKSRPVLVEAVGTQMTERVAWEESTITHEPHVLGPSAHLWSRTTMTAADVDVALLYDGFTFNCLSWLEGLGFCGIGEAKDFLAGGRNIALDGGVVALNPHGGQLSAGRTHGMGFVHEAVVQLRGEGGERQRRDAEVAVLSSGGLTPAGAILLRRA
ncbi:MAG: OB-fold domain-containing protein [Actinomycetota bacterium]|nr:OB-fold domain-containing protein [Actinomycetota bacterium]